MMMLAVWRWPYAFRQHHRQILAFIIASEKANFAADLGIRLAAVGGL